MKSYIDHFAGLSLRRYFRFRFVTVVLAFLVACLPLPNSTRADNVTWIVDGDGTWATESNWSSGVVPGALDDVTIDRLGTSTITIFGTTQSIHSIFSNENISLSSNGGLSVASDSTINGALNMSGFSSTLSGTGNITLSGPVLWSQGAMTGTGKTVLSSTSTTFISSSSNSVTLSRTIDNLGVVTTQYAQSFNNFVFNGGVFNNLAGGTFNFNFGNITASGSNNAFNNSGTFNKSVAVANSIAVPINNLATGVINLDAGALSGSTVTNIGTINVGANADLAMNVQNTGTVNFNGPETLGNQFDNKSSGIINVLSGTLSTTTGLNTSNAGTIDIAAGAKFAINGIYSQLAGSKIKGAGTLSIAGGTSHFATALEVTGPILMGGVINLNANQTFNGNLSLLSAGSLGGSGNFDFSGPFDWAGGSMGGTGKTTFNADAITTVSTGGSVTRVADNNGVFNHSGTNAFGPSNGGVFNNIGIFNLTNTGGISGSGTGTFNNEGVVNKTGSTAASTITSKFVNSTTGVVNLVSGTATFSSGAGSTNAGVINVGSEVTYLLENGLTHLAGSSIRGPGSVAIPNITSGFLGSIQVTGQITITNQFSTNADQMLSGPVTMSSSAQLNGTGNVTIANSLTWTTGQMLGTGKLIIGPNGTATFNPTNGVSTAKVIENNGTFDHNTAASLQFNTGAAFNNNGVLNFLNTGGFSNSTTTALTNTGTINKLTASSSGVAYLTNSETGHINVQAGTFTIGNGSSFFGSNGGDINISSGATFTIFNGFDFAQLPGSSINGAGMLNIGAPITNFSGKLNSTGLIGISNAITFNTDQVIAGTMKVGGSLAQFKGTGNIKIANTVTWNGGSMLGTGKVTIEPNASLIVTSLGTLNVGQALENKGLMTQSGSIGLTNSTIDNRGVFESFGAVSISTNSGTTAFNNYGTFEYERAPPSGPSTTLTIATPFTNKPTGIINVLSGVMSFTSQGTNEGTMNITPAGGLSITSMLLNKGIINLNGSTTLPTSYTIDNAATGQINVLSNFVAIAGGSNATTRANAGIINVSESAGLVFSSDYEQLAGSSIKGKGSVSFSSRQTKFAGALEVTGPISILEDIAFNSNQIIVGSTIMGNQFSTSNAAISGAGDVTFKNAVTFYSSKTSGTGKLIIGQDATATFGSSNSSTTATLSREIVNNGIVNMVSSTSTNRITLNNGTITNNGVFNAVGTIDGIAGAFNNNGIFNANGVTVSAPLNNTGTVNVYGGLNTFGTNLTGSNSGVIIIEGSGDPSRPSSAVPFASTFVNTGTIVLNGSHTGVAIPSGPGSQIKFTSGTTSFFTPTSASYSGNLDIAAGSSVALFLSQSSFTATSSITGAGSITLGTVPNFSGKFLHSGVTSFGGPITFNVDQTFVGGVVLNSPSILDGPGNLNMNGYLTWTAGSMAGTGKTTLAANSVATMKMTAPVGLSRVFDNLGTMNYEANAVNFAFHSGTINNIGTFNALKDGTLVSSDGTNLFNNSGVLTKSNAGTTTTIEIPFSNSGIVNVQAGALLLNGPVTQAPSRVLTAGTWNVTSDGTLAITSPAVIDTIGVNTNVMISGVDSKIINFAPTVNEGRFTLAQGKHFEVLDSFTNDGILTIENTAALSTGPLLHSPDKGTINVNLGGEITAGNLHTHVLNLNGKATVLENGTSTGASKVETLAMGPQAMLNLKSNDLVVGTGDLAVIRDLIKSGTSSNSPTLPAGITSDMADFKVKTGFAYALGNDPNLSPLLNGKLSGESFDENSVLVKYTLLGDADLDGDSDLNDLGLWSSKYTGDLGVQQSPTTFWTGGDFDYDGDTDLNDLGLWSSTYTGDLNGGPGSLVVFAPVASAVAVEILNGMGFTVVPEPGSIFLAVTAFLGLVVSVRKYRYCV